MQQMRAPQQAARAGAQQTQAKPGEWDVVSTSPAPPPPREVGFLESAGRTAASAATPIVRGLDMAAAGLAGMLAPIFGLNAEQEQAKIFSDAEARSARMREAYAPQPGEEMSMLGQMAGGVASMPAEVLGGFGAARGLERSADVVQRGGTLGEAGVAGGVTAGANMAANLLPLKLGGTAGQRAVRLPNRR